MPTEQIFIRHNNNNPIQQLHPNQIQPRLVRWCTRPSKIILIWETAYNLEVEQMQLISKELCIHHIIWIPTRIIALCISQPKWVNMVESWAETNRTTWKILIRVKETSIYNSQNKKEDRPQLCLKEAIKSVNKFRHQIQITKILQIETRQIQLNTQVITMVLLPWLVVQV